MPPKREIEIEDDEDLTAKTQALLGDDSDTGLEIEDDKPVEDEEVDQDLVGNLTI